MEEEGNMRKKIMSTLVVVTMILASFMVMTIFDMSVIDKVQATRAIRTDPATDRIGVALSNDGTGDIQDYLTCGELITLYVYNNSLTKDEDYFVKVWNGTHWNNVTDIGSTDNADKYGDLAIQFHVPGWSELAKNPLANSGDTGLSNGQYNISLFDEANSHAPTFPGLNITIQIGNLYDVYFKYNGEEVDYLIQGRQYSQFYIYVRNWTGSSGWENNVDSSGEWNLTLSSPYNAPTDFPITESQITAYYKDIDFDLYESYMYSSTPNNYEYFYTVNITRYNTAAPALYSNVTLPIKLNVTASIPSNLEWGDTIGLSGYVLNGNGTGMSGYTVRLYAPTATDPNGAYISAYSTETFSTGRYSISVETGPDTGYAAGTWYLGTYDTGTHPTRIDESDQMPYAANFIPYYSFEVGTNDGAKLTVRNTEDIISDFNQTINVSIYNASWMWSGDSDTTMEWNTSNFQVTGLDCWDPVNNVEYTSNDIVPVSATWKKTDSNEKYAYYEFTWVFNETGAATILWSWPGNLTDHEGNDSYESNTYNANVSILNNITGSTTINVVSPSEMNLVVSGTMVDSVQVTEGSNDAWKNTSQQFTLNVYGSSSSERMNATIKITGCGLDITVEEDDTEAGNEYLVSKGYGQYTIKIQPKTAGTLTITATNDTEGTSVTQDYTITGLTGTVTTSVGDDLAITVGSTETITATITNGDYAEVHLTYYDSDWSNAKSLNVTVGDGTAGEGQGGVFTFVPDEDDLDSVGYIVVAAKAGSSSYMYDVIEIEPIYDLSIEMVNPVSTNKSLTVGLEVDISVQLLGPSGDAVEDDSPAVVGKLTDADHNEDDPIQTITFSSSGDEWEADNVILWQPGTLIISGYNASDGMRHEGNVSIDVGMATITYSPAAATAGIDTRNLTVTITCVDANGDPLPESTHVYMYCEDSEDVAVGGTASNTNAVNFKTGDDDITLDEDGVGEFTLREVGDNKTTINATLQNNNPSTGNETNGVFSINFPVFTLDPSTIYIGQSNVVKITAKDSAGDPIQGVNLTFLSSLAGIIPSQPDPVETNADGVVQLSVSPVASGKLNVTIARNLHYTDGQLNWTNAVVTDSYVTVTSISEMKISLSKSPIYQGETLTVTVTSGTNKLSGVAVEFAETTVQTDANGQASFTVPDPGVESAVYTVTAEKDGYVSTEKSVTVIKVYSVVIVTPSQKVYGKEEFTITTLAKGMALAGATVTFDGKTYTSGADGKVTLTAPDVTDANGKDFPITATFESYQQGTATVHIEKTKGVPGFELITLIAALGVAFILLRRRR